MSVCGGGCGGGSGGGGGGRYSLPPSQQEPYHSLKNAPSQYPYLPLTSLSGLGTWALSAQRGPDLLSLNKEGIVSCTGYWALHLAGSALARSLHDTAQRYLPTLREMCGGSGEGDIDGGWNAHYQEDAGLPLPNDSVVGHLGISSSRRGGCVSPPPGRISGAAPDLTSSSPPNHSSLLTWLGSWVCVDVALWACLAVLELTVERRSRRSCNAAYVVWTAALGLSLLLPLMAAQVRGGGGGGGMRGGRPL